MSRLTLKVCAGSGCVAGGSLRLAALLRDAVADRDGVDARVEAVRDLGAARVGITGCRGFCARGPLLAIPELGLLYCGVGEQDVDEILETTVRGRKVIQRLLFDNPAGGGPCRNEREIPFFGKQSRKVLRRCGEIDPEQIDDFIRLDGYAALARALREMSPADVIEEIKRSGLQGRGGAGFPAGMKWQLVADAPAGEKFVVCNADEGDPGAFMDRSLIEGDPHAIIEGICLAAFAVGASRGLVYLRTEYTLAMQRMLSALAQARQRGFLGRDILGVGFDFELSVAEGAGAFVCGEETALLHSIEGRRGMPTPRPPYPADEGLWGRPTLIGNVETFANVPPIVAGGAAEYCRVGTALSKGTKIFSLTGAVNNIGLIEVPMGITLREVVFDIGGGIPGERAFKAVQFGGPTGSCLSAAHLDTPLDYGSLREQGGTLGSGGLVVLDESSCMVELARYFMEFCVEESCGKCPPCRIGTRVMLNILEELAAGRGREDDIERLESLGRHIQRTSLCGLGQNAPGPTLSAIRHFRDEFEAHILERRCPAGECDSPGAGVATESH